MGCYMRNLLIIMLLLAFVTLGSVAKTKVGKIRDRDKDGIPNAIDEDIDGDGVPNIVEVQHGTNPYNPMSYLIEDTFLGGG